MYFFARPPRRSALYLDTTGPTVTDLWAAKLAAIVRGILGMPDLTRPADQT
jgi:hypothetical protein